MRLLFLHQNFPGQFRHLVPVLCDDPALQVAALGEPAAIERAAASAHPRLMRFAYKPPAAPGGGAAAAGDGVHPYLRDVDAHVRRGQVVARALQQLADKGYVPDAIVAHPGWGESLFVKDVLPQAKLLNYFEFYFSATGADVGFDPEYPGSLDAACRLRMRNGNHLLALDACDGGIAPTHWQWSRFPAIYRPKIAVVHEGVDTDVVRPDPAARVVVKTSTGERLLTRDVPVLTYVARNLEPYRGFHVFMRALPDLLRAHPTVQVVVVGGDEVSYGRRLPPGQTYRDRLLKELADAGRPIDPDRVHFTGKLPYAQYLRVLQVSRLHVYLTYPFVLSWSMLEAMACGCLVLGSRTAPVQEVIEHGRNGLLVDFFDGTGLVQQALQALNEPARHDPLRAQARATAVERYDLKRVCLPAGLARLREVAGLPA